jgi:hypothetical protein
MKKILFLLMIAFPGLLSAQRYQDPLLYGERKNRLRADSVFQLPIGLGGTNNGKRTSTLLPSITYGYDTGQVRYNIPDSSIKVYTGSQWLNIGGGGAGGSNNSNAGTGYRLLKPSTQEIKTLFPGYGSLFDSTTNTDGITLTIDTATLSAKYARTNGTNATGIWPIDIAGNAATVTNGVYISGNYSNPSWINSLAWSKITGAPTTLSGYGITDALSTTLADGRFLVGNISSVATAVLPSGDVTFDNTGAFTIGPLKVATGMIQAGAVTLAKMADVASGTVFYRKTTGVGSPEVNTLATLKTDLGLTGTNSGDQTSIVGITGTKAQFNVALTDGDFLFVGDVTGLTDGDKGDITVSGSGLTWVIDNAAVTYAKIANGTGLSVIGRSANSAGVNADIVGTTDQVLRVATDGLSLSFGTVATGGITNNAVTLAKMAQVATSTVFYRKTAGTGDPEVNTLATLKTDLGLTGTNSGDQTISNTSDATSHTVTLSNGGGSFQLVEGSGITLTTTGTGSAGIITITSTGGGISLAAIGSTPNANAATLAGSVLNLEPASASFGGVVTTGAQTFAGAKTVTSLFTATGGLMSNGFDYTSFRAGFNALISEISSGYNVAIGGNALKIATGAANIAIGYGALENLTTGIENVAVGPDAMKFANGSFNMALGRYSMFGTSNSGSYNTAIGYSTMKAASQTGNNNVSIGAYAGFSIVSASDNTIVGYSGMSQHTSGNNNVAIGRDAGANNLTGASNVFIGFSAGYNETGSNKLYIENSTSSTPLIYGEFDNDLVKINTKLVWGSIASDPAGQNGMVYYNTTSNRLFGYENSLWKEFLMNDYGSDATGDILYRNSSGYYTRLGIGNAADVLTVSGGLPVWSAPGGGSAHNILSATHTDAAIGTVARGDLITGQGVSPTWTKLVKGSANQIFQSDGTDIGWVSLSGDATLSSGTLTISGNAVTVAKMQQIATASVLGRVTAATGNVEVLTATQLTTLINSFSSTLSGAVPASGGGTTNFLRADGTWAAPPGGVSDGDKGDITVSASGVTWTIDADVVTYAKMQNVSATSRIMGRITAGAGDMEELTGAQATTLLDLFSTTTTTKGLVPGSNNVGSSYFLNAAGTWAVPAGGGDMVLASAQTNSGVKTFLDATMGLRNVANTFTSFFTNTNSASRTYTLQNANGTLAFLSDITGTNSGTNTGDQTVNNTSDATSHTVTLSASGGSVQLIEGSGITLTTGGTGSAGTVTIASTAGGGDMVLASVQSVTGLKTFDKDKLAMKGTSTGVTTISTANTSATNYTATLQAATGTIAYLSDIPSTPGIDAVLAVGQTLTNNRTISSSTFQILIDGTGSPLKVNTTVNTGIEATATSGTALIATNTTGTYAARIFTTSGIASMFQVNPSSTNTIVPIVDILRQSSGTPANGIGGSLQFWTGVTAGVAERSGYIVSKWTDVAGRTSQFDLMAVSANASQTFMNIQTGGVVIVNNLADTLSTKAYARSVGGSGGGANTALSNLASVSINTALIPQTGIDLGAATTAFRDLYLYGAGTFATTSLKLTGTPTGNRVITFPDATGTVTFDGTASTFSAVKTFSSSPVISSITNTGTLTLPTVTGTIAQKSFASITSNATWSPQGDASINFYDITAQAVAVTAISAPGGTPTNGNELYIRVVDNGTARALGGWNAIYAGGTNLALPTTTTAGKYMTIKFIYNTMNSINKWQLVAVLDGL